MSLLLHFWPDISNPICYSFFLSIIFLSDNYAKHCVVGERKIKIISK